MLKFGLEIALGMLQKSDAGIFEILNFRDFSGGQSPNFRHFDLDIIRKIWGSESAEIEI